VLHTLTFFKYKSSDTINFFKQAPTFLGIGYHSISV